MHNEIQARQTHTRTHTQSHVYNSDARTPETPVAA